MTEPPHKRPRRSEIDNDHSRDGRSSRNIERNGRDDRDRGGRRDERNSGRGGGGRRDYSDRERDRDRDRQENRDRVERRDERDSGRGDERGGSRRSYGDRNGESRRYDERDSTSWRGGSDGARDRKRPREDEKARRSDRSRSPRRDQDREREREPLVEARDSPIPLRMVEAEDKKRTATPPVSFTVPHADGTGSHSHRENTPGGEVMEGITKSSSKARKGKEKPKKMDVEEESEEEIVVEEDNAMVAMQAMMGFGGFGTTKQKKVPGNDISAVRKEKKTEYRQYMNRVGGFNRPLSPGRD